MRPDAPQDPPIQFLVDRSLGRVQVVEALRRAGAVALALDDRFAQNTPDPDWLLAAARQGLVVLSKDLFNPYERQLIMDSGGRAFVLSRGDLTGEEMARIFVRALPTMLRKARRGRHAFIFRISRGGQFTRVS